MPCIEADSGQEGDGRTRLVNLTPHAVNISSADGVDELIIPPSGVIARLHVSRPNTSALATNAGTVVRNELRFGAVEGLPDPEPGVWLLVALPVALVERRPDLLVVDEVVRGADGQVVSCRSLGTVTT